MVIPECKCRRVGPPSYELRGPRYGELTISMAKCEGLALVTLARIEKVTNLIKGCDKDTQHLINEIVQV